jgi:hypothetical protein
MELPFYLSVVLLQRSKEKGYLSSPAVCYTCTIVHLADNYELA